MQSSTCHVVAGAKRVRLERIVSPQACQVTHWRFTCAFLVRIMRHNQSPLTAAANVVKIAQGMY